MTQDDKLMLVAAFTIFALMFINECRKDPKIRVESVHPDGCSSYDDGMGLESSQGHCYDLEASLSIEEGDCYKLHRKRGSYVDAEEIPCRSR